MPKLRPLFQIRRQLQSKRMCEGDSAQAQLMVKDQETSVTMEGMEMMVAAMNSEQLGKAPGTRVHVVKYRERGEMPA